jgi:hypothetical protein
MAFAVLVIARLLADQHLRASGGPSPNTVCVALVEVARSTPGGLAPDVDELRCAQPRDPATLHPDECHATGDELRAQLVSPATPDDLSVVCLVLTSAKPSAGGSFMSGSVGRSGVGVGP